MTAEPTRDNGETVDIDSGADEPEIETALSPHDQRLFDLASRIDQGHAIDWEAAERDATDDRERAIIAEMRLLADVARVGRDQAIPADPLAADLARAGVPRSGPNHTDTNGERFDYEPPPPATWGSLAIHEPIGRGAFATVYRAQDNLGRLVALKLFPLPDELAMDWAARLLHEGRLLARLQHQNVVTVYGADQGDGYVGLWMEFVKGRTLEDELHTRVRFSADEAVQVGRVLCRALAAVHREGLLHRDVKAHNVMRDETGRIVLMDFGSGREAGLEDARGGGDLVGTPLYLAPEVFAGQPASIASDIYSLGVLLFHLVSDRYPVQGANRAEIQHAHAERRRLYLRDARPDLPDAFVRVIERALSADRAQRYQSAGELEDALASINDAAGSGASSAPALPPAPASDVEERTPRYRWQMITAGASVLLAALLLFIMRPASTSQTPTPAAATPSTSPAPAPPPQTIAPGPYAVQASFYKKTRDNRVPLASGDGVAPRDQLGLRLKISKPAYVYVANQDEEGAAFVMYPLRDQPAPLAAGREHRLPEDETGELWNVTSVGGREHFVVLVSPEPMPELDQLLREVPRVLAGRAVTVVPIPKNLMRRVPRGVGGLAPVERAGPSSVLDGLFDRATELSSKEETVEGEWVRKLMLINPVPRPR